MNRFPTADEIATAIVRACGLFGEDPRTIDSGDPLRGRWMALAALRDGFPHIAVSRLARFVGFKPPRGCHNAQQKLTKGPKASWWRDRDLRLVAVSLEERIIRTDSASVFFPSKEGEETDTPPPAAPIELPRPPVSSAAKAMADFQRGRFDPVIRRESAAPAAPESSRALAINGTRVPIERHVARVRSQEADARAARALATTSTAATAISYRPDAPAHARNVHIMTADLMGDPSPQRSALWERQNSAEAITDDD